MIPYNRRIRSVLNLYFKSISSDIIEIHVIRAVFSKNIELEIDYSNDIYQHKLQ